jgi:hypothetical protein
VTGITERTIDANRGGITSHAAVRRFLDSLKLLP